LRSKIRAQCQVLRRVRHKDKLGLNEYQIIQARLLKIRRIGLS
jgi:hypothetical protein